MIESLKAIQKSGMLSSLPSPAEIAGKSSTFSKMFAAAQTGDDADKTTKAASAATKTSTTSADRATLLALQEMLSPSSKSKTKSPTDPALIGEPPATAAADLDPTTADTSVTDGTAASAASTAVKKTVGDEGSTASDLLSALSTYGSALGMIAPFAA